MANGTSFSIDIDANADSAESAAKKVAALAERLELAGAASKDASAAMAAAQAAYAQTETTADRAAKALEKINIAVAQQQNKVDLAIADGEVETAELLAVKLEKLKARQAEAASSAEKAQAALAAEAASLDKLKAAAAAAADEESVLTKAHKDAEKAAEDLAKAEEAAAGSGNFKDLADGAKKLGGPLGKVAGVAGDASEGFEKLTSSVGAAGGVYIAAAAAIAIVTVALVAGVVALAKWAITAADAARSQRLFADAAAGSVAGGAMLNAQIRDLEDRVPVARDELLKMATDLRKTGLQGKALGKALESAAIDAAKAKFGDNWEKEMKSLTNQSSRLERNIASLFAGPKVQGSIDKFLDGLSSIGDLFSESSESGQAMRVVAEDLFSKLIDGANSFIPTIRSAFLQFEILVLKALIAIKPFGSTIVMVAKLVAVSFGVIAAVVGAVLGAIATSLFVMFVVPVMAAVAAIYLLVEGVKIAWGWLSSLASTVAGAVSGAFASLKEAFDTLSNMSLVEIGSRIIEGLAQGIMNGGAAVLSAITGVVGGAIDAAKGLLGIHSPSKVFAEIGANTAEGMAGGVEDSTAMVQGSLESMVSPPASTGPVEATASGGGNTFNITVNASGGDAGSIAQSVKEAILELFEGEAAQRGRAVPA